MKHGILRRYLPIYVRKVGSRAPKHRVAYLDGYAGPGRYEDDSAGSPAIALQTAQVVSTVDLVNGYFVEQDEATCQALSDFLAGAEMSWSTYHGRLEDHLDAILDAIGETPLFAFLDPFGLPIPMAMIRGRLMARGGHWTGRRRVGGVPTEILINFSLPGLRRNAGHLGSSKTTGSYPKARATKLQRLGASLGGSWWHPLWLSGSADREQLIFEGYIQRLLHGKGDWTAFSAPVAKRWAGSPVYYLVLLTQHPDGRWLFHEALSSSLEEYRDHCIEIQAQRQLDFEPLELREKEWISKIGENIQELLRAGPFVVQDRMEQVYGDTLGFAREKHVRKAIKQLNKQGLTGATGVGIIATMRITAMRTRATR